MWIEKCVTCKTKHEVSKEEYLGECADIYRGDCVVCRAPMCLSCVGNCPSCGRPVCEEHAAASPAMAHQKQWCPDCIAGDEAIIEEAA